MKILPVSIIVGLCFLLQTATIAQEPGKVTAAGEPDRISVVLFGDESAVLEGINGDSTLWEVRLAGPEVGIDLVPGASITIDDLLSPGVTGRIVDETLVFRGDFMIWTDNGDVDPNARRVTRLTVRDARVEISM